VSKTTYLDDAEGNTIELYVRSLDDASFEMINGQVVVRYADGRIGDGRDPLDVAALFGELDAGVQLDLPLPEGTRLGHMHLYVSSLETSMGFYARLLGFQPGPMLPIMRMGEVGLDEQQPHVVAFNTWKGEGIPPAPPRSLGLRYFTVVLPSKEELQRVVARLQASGVPAETTPDGVVVHDPSRITMLLTEHMLPTTAGRKEGTAVEDNGSPATPDSPIPG
jgi:catechol 2,3-dioxygenase